MKNTQVFVTMKDYEKQRMRRIQENRARMCAAGIFKLKESLNTSSKKTTAKQNSKRKGLEEDEEYLCSSDPEEFSISSAGENNIDEEDLVITKRSMVKNRRLSMTEFIANEMGHGKTSQTVHKLHPNTRSRVLHQNRPRAILTEDVINKNGLTMQVGEFHRGNRNTQVALIQSHRGGTPQNSDQLDATQSDIPLNGQEPTGMAKSTKCTSKKGRSWAKPWLEWDNGIKKILEWNEDYQPLGPLEPKLTSHLGNLARNGDLFPLTMKSWRKADKDTLDNIWNSVKINTNAPEGFKECCFKKLGTYWKHFKHRTKQDYYKKFQTDEERLAHVPPRVESNQWPKLVSHWGLEKTKKVAIQNSKNRESQCAYSRTGRTPHATIIDGMVKQGKPIDQITIWNETRKPKNKSFNTEDGALHRADHLERRLKEFSEEEQNDPEIRNKIFMEVVGSDGHGHALLKGVGTKLASKRLNFSSSTLMDEIVQLRKEAEDRDTLHKQEVEKREASHKQDVEEREARHQQEIQQLKVDMKQDLISLLSKAGIQVPDDTLCTTTNYD